MPMVAKIQLTKQLRDEYERLYAEAVIRPERRAEVLVVARKMVGVWSRYEAVASSLGCPAHLVALIHAMECGLDFSRHLHNGDPLTARTTHVPAGRPAAGIPPFRWGESAADALAMRHVDAWHDWSIPGLCYTLEGYNGWGYRLHHPEVPSPYLWSFTTVYTAGKYVSDGAWSSTAVSKQPGAMALLRGLADCGHPYDAQPIPATPSDPDPDPDPVESHPYPGTVLRLGSTGDTVRQVQEQLTSLGYSLGAIDGLYWRRTCDAVRAFQRERGMISDGVVGPETWAALWRGE